MTPEYQQFFGKDFTLETNRVLLRLMQPEDFEALEKLANDPEIFRWFSKDLSQPGELKTWMDDAFNARVAGTRAPLVIIDKDTQEVCGCTSYGNINFPEQRIEIGWTWLGKDYIGMGVNRQAKFALISFAFYVMHIERVELKTDALNERARAAALKVGMIPEGILRSHMIVQNGRRRDSMYFSILRSEWPERMQSFFNDMI
ncbi:MAG: GNAT family protein [Flavitalea sp.]